MEKNFDLLLALAAVGCWLRRWMWKEEEGEGRVSSEESLECPPPMPLAWCPISSKCPSFGWCPSPCGGRVPSKCPVTERDSRVVSFFSLVATAVRFAEHCFGMIL